MARPLAFSSHFSLLSIRYFQGTSDTKYRKASNFKPPRCGSSATKQQFPFGQNRFGPVTGIPSIIIYLLLKESTNFSIYLGKSKYFTHLNSLISRVRSLVVEVVIKIYPDLCYQGAWKSLSPAAAERRSSCEVLVVPCEVRVSLTLSTLRCHQTWLAGKTTELQGVFSSTQCLMTPEGT